MKEYLDLLRDVHDHGRYKYDRTKVGCHSVFGRQVRFDLSKGFPMCTTKKLHLRSIIHELLWFLKGDTNIAYLKEHGVRIWDEWAQPEDEFLVLTKCHYDIKREWENIQSAAGHYPADLTHTLPPEIRQVSLGGPSVEDVDGYVHHYRSEPYGDHLNEWFAKTGIEPTFRVQVKRKGDLGPIYGEQWRSWKDIDGRTHDQITNAIELLRRDPASRRNVVSAWNVGQLDKMHLNPCHALFQFYAEELTLNERVTLYIAKQYPEGISAAQYNADHLLGLVKEQENYEATAHLSFCATMEIANLQLIEAILEEHKIPKHRLSCQLYQRSADIFLGVPFNIASYALLTHMVAHVVGMAPGDFVHTFGDLHVYSNHIEQIELQMTREPMPLPKLLLNPNVKDIFDFTIDDIKIVGYESHPAIKGDVAV